MTDAHAARHEDGRPSLEPASLELGVYSFAETAIDARTGAQVEAGQRLRDLVDEIVLADQVGLDVFGVGEHHRADFASSAPAVILAAAAARTTRIRLTSAVTVLSSDDPVRVFQQYATLDLLSRGRAEIMAGRGSFTESFPLFGFDLADYDALFAEKLDLLLALRRGERVTWAGASRTADGRPMRPTLRNAPVYPRPEQNPIPVWVAVGGTPQSIARAAMLGLPISVAIIGGEPARFAPLVALYRESARRAGQDPADLPVSINTHGYIADTTARAGDEFFPPYAVTMSRIGRERGWPPVTRQQFEGSRRPGGALAVGTPEEVAEKIVAQHALFGHQRHLLQLSVGPMPRAQIMRAIELLGTRVAPLVRRELSTRGGRSVVAYPREMSSAT